MDFEWSIFTGFSALQFSDEVKSLLLKFARHKRISQEESYSCRFLTTIPVDQKQ